MPLVHEKPGHEKESKIEPRGTLGLYLRVPAQIIDTVVRAISRFLLYESMFGTQHGVHGILRQVKTRKQMQDTDILARGQNTLDATVPC
jgi:hypothetical protein